MIEEMKNKTGLKLRTISGALELDYRRLQRWRERANAGLPLLQAPGPKKTGPLPLAELRAEIEALCHRRKRTAGAGALATRYKEGISRRALTALIAAERNRRNQAEQQACKQVSWRAPNVAWAIDATERGRDRKGRKLYVHAVQDLCTRYRFAPLVALESKGQAVAAHLVRLFRRHGAPLFLKRDNGSALNDQAVQTVLATHGVIPLNSPARYPRYNGAVEKGIREMKDALGACFLRPASWDPLAVNAYIVAVQHALNARPRRSLHGLTACDAYYHQPHARLTKRERLATFEWIRIHANDRINQLEKIDRRSINAAWRRAAETWLRCQGLITVSINRKVLPNLPLLYA
jgi:transposase InsO family protein